jgi:RimJ/RimL family protein N-acetyltransferase
VTYPDNHASQRVLDKLGFERRGFTEYKGVRTSYHVLTRERWARDVDFDRAGPP